MHAFNDNDNDMKQTNKRCFVNIFNSKIRILSIFYFYLFVSIHLSYDNL